MRKPRVCDPATTSVYHLRFLVGGWVPDLSDSQFRPLAHGLDHPVPRLRAAYAARIEQHRGICCDLSAFGKILAQSYARWWKIRNPGGPKVWRDRFWSQLLPNNRPATLAAASAAILETLRAHGIRPANYPWRAAACPPPEPPPARFQPRQDPSQAPSACPLRRI